MVTPPQAKKLPDQGDQKDILLALFDAAVTAAQPEHCLPSHLPPKPDAGRLKVIGFGKSAAAMARVVEDHYGDAVSGAVVTRYGHEVACKHVSVLSASHPVPDAAGMAATDKILGHLDDLTEDDLVLCLISGGGSALFETPPPGIDLEDVKALTDALLRCGATIAEINAIRKRFSRVKGGRLARLCALARVMALVISDVPGDDLSEIASGPLVPDTVSLDEVFAILARYEINLPAAMSSFLQDGKAQSPSENDSAFDNVEHRMIATPQLSLEAAAQKARQLGLTPLILSDRLEGETRSVAQTLAAIADQISRTGQPATTPCVLLSGGETTVTLNGIGDGGPNTEFALALAAALGGHPNISAIACDTDGIDGNRDAAGAVVFPNTMARAEAKGLDASQFLMNNNSYMFFENLGDLVTPGPTLTNVNDFRAILIT